MGKDVAVVLGYKLPRKAILDHVEKDDVLKWNLIDAIGRKQQTILINESGLYSLILSSKAIIVHVDDEDKTSYLIQVSGSNYKAMTILINESGLYSLIRSSKRPSATSLGHQSWSYR